MGWMKLVGLVSVLALAAACGGKKSKTCSSNDQCPEGSWCDTEIESCIPACDTPNKAPCVEGHFCNPETRLCVTECPFACAAATENGTVECKEGCPVTCNSDSHLCGDSRCASNADVNACEADCRQCTTTDANADPTCENNKCSATCKTGFRPSETGCLACPDGDCRTIQPVTPTTFGEKKLMWQACAAGYMGNDCTLETGTPKKMNWDAAVKYCEDSTWHGDTDWRLPTQPSFDLTAGELGSIVVPCSTPKYQQGNACIDNEAFPNTPADWFWSSSPDVDDPNYAWFVIFNNGDAALYKKTYTFYVRCVRGGL